MCLQPLLVPITLDVLSCLHHAAAHRPRAMSEPVKDKVQVFAVVPGLSDRWTILVPADFSYSASCIGLPWHLSLLRK
jgi:hypothetical protein